MDSGEKRATEIFLRALDLPESRRDGYLDRACGGSSSLRREVESLLAHRGQTPAILKTGAGVADL